MFHVILANTHREAAKFARQATLPRGSFRYATRAATIRGLRVSEIHELPSFKERRDRHAINAALRWTKGKRRRAKLRADQYDDVDRCHEIALRYEALRTEKVAPEAPSPAPVPENEPAPSPAEPADKPNKPAKKAAPKKAAVVDEDLF